MTSNLIIEKQNEARNLMIAILYNVGRVTSYTIIGGIVNVDFNIDKSETYVIVKDNIAVLGI